MPFLAAAEICRRTMWGCFRLENEHLHNTQNFRRVAFVPLHFETAVARVSALHACGCFALFCLFASKEVA